MRPLRVHDSTLRHCCWSMLTT